MLAAAAATLVLAAAVAASPSPRLLPLLAAALRSAPQAVSPSPAAVGRMLGTALFAAPERHSDSDAEWLRFQSRDGTCTVELGPIVRRKVVKLLAGCRFATRYDAIRFLHEMVVATRADWRPPMTYPPDSEIAHLALILIGRTPVSAEAYLIEDGDDRWRATVVLALGGRSVIVPKSR